MTFHPNAKRERPSAWIGILFMLAAIMVVSGFMLLAVHLTR